MADSSVAITAGTGTNIDTATQGNGDHRQVVVMGDATATSTRTVYSDGSAAVRKAPSTTGTVTSVTAAAASTLVLASNTSRLGATVYNDSTATLYLALAGSASTTAYTVQLPGGGYFELPNDGCGYTGTLYGIWSAANGAARITELT